LRQETKETWRNIGIAAGGVVVACLIMDVVAERMGIVANPPCSTMVQLLAGEVLHIVVQALP
jgi:hypothetical protein